MAQGEASAWSGTFRRAHVHTKSVTTMTLGELRDLVAKCDGMNDGAVVKAGGVSSTSTAGEYYLKVLRVEEETVNR